MSGIAQVAQGRKFILFFLIAHRILVSNIQRQKDCFTSRAQLTVVDALVAVEHMLHYPYPRDHLAAGEVDCYILQCVSFLLLSLKALNKGTGFNCFILSNVNPVTLSTGRDQSYLNPGVCFPPASNSLSNAPFNWEYVCSCAGC